MIESLLGASDARHGEAMLRMEQQPRRAVTTWLDGRVALYATLGTLTTEASVAAVLGVQWGRL